MDDSSLTVDDSITSNSFNGTNESMDDFSINETIDGSDSGVIENSIIVERSRIVEDAPSVLTNSSFEGHSRVNESTFDEGHSNVNESSVAEHSKVNESTVSEHSKVNKSSVKEDCIDISDDDESIGKLDIEEDESSDASAEIQIIDSSDDQSSNSKPSSTKQIGVKMEHGVKFEPGVGVGVKSEKIQSTIPFERAVKFESGVKLEPSVKFESGAKFEPDDLEELIDFEPAVTSGVKVESASKLNPLQLVDDIKPIHTGKVGMATFNSQHAKAVSLMQNLCKSLDVKPTENDFADNPKQLKIELMPHQRSALTWMIWREDQKPKGGILADDMGLGKTMSMISLVVKKRYDEAAENTDQSSGSSGDEEEQEKEDNKSSWVAKGSRSQSYYYGGTLVVCPASVMDQWKNEVNNRLKRNALSVVLHHGSNREARPRTLAKPDMVITTYGIVSSEADNNGALFSVKWERIILDEAHIIRNHNSKQSIACCKLKGSARWALTGTPIQNKEADLYALLKFLHCRPFDDHSSFKMWISKSSTKSQERLNQVLQALLLRRTKEDLKEIGQIESLPEKRKEIVSVKLTTEEMNVYQKVMIYSQALFAQYLHQRETRNNFGMATNSEQKAEWAKLHQQISKVHGSAAEAISGHHILILILRLRQICIHPCLIDAMLGDGDLDDEDSDEENLPEVDLLDQLSKLQIGSEVQEDETVSKASSKVMLRSNSVFDERRTSSKFQKIIEFISEKVIGTDDKGIVVSQFASVLKMFGDHLQNMGIKFAMLTGATKISSRNEIVTNFNRSSSSTQILLLSLTAGGVGLNLVGANHLFFVDPHWNPQLENQAQDRIYRIGQKKPVTIYKFLCEDTIERRIQHLQDSKLQIATQVLTGAKRTSSKLTMQDMKTLFEL